MVIVHEIIAFRGIAILLVVGVIDNEDFSIIARHFVCMLFWGRKVRLDCSHNMQTLIGKMNLIGRSELPVQLSDRVYEEE